MTKRPGWGLVPPRLPVLETRASPAGQLQALICPPDHEAPFWVDLQQIAQHRARAIYQPLVEPLS